MNVRPPDRCAEGRTRRAASLAVADRDELVELADSLIARLGEPTVVAQPEVGTVMMQVREPVCRERFHLGEVVVSRAEVLWHGSSGWAMRLGTDRVATLAAAVCDAAAAMGDERAAADVAELCRRNDRRLAAQRNDEWAAMQPTRVHFEELD